MLPPVNNNHRFFQKKSSRRTLQTAPGDYFGPLFITVLIACLIIFIGYRFIDIVGDYFMITDTAITAHSNFLNDSYIFYSQSDSDITLYPWAYYDDSAPNYYEYVMNYDQLYTDEFDLNNYIDANELYEQIRYSFYQSVPEIKPIILKAHSSLYEIMDFDNIMYDLSVTTFNNQLFFFYQKDLTIDDEVYNMSFAMNNRLELLSFQCRPLNNSSYTQIGMNLAKRQITKLINDNYCNCFTLLIYDILYHERILENYKVVSNSYGDYTFYLNSELYYDYWEKHQEEGEFPSEQDDYDKSYYSDYNEYYYNINVSDADDDVDGTTWETIKNSVVFDDKDISLLITETEEAPSMMIDTNVTYTSDILDNIFAADDITLTEISNHLYQKQMIVRNDELLVIIPDNNIVLHFDPYSNVFTGFNRING